MRLLSLASFIALVFVTLFLSLRKDWNFVRDSISRLHFTSNRISIQISGDLNLHLPTWEPSLRARQVSILGEDDNGSRLVLLYVENVQVSLSLITLFRGVIRLTAFSLQAVELNIDSVRSTLEHARVKDGKTNSKEKRSGSFAFQMVQGEVYGLRFLSSSSEWLTSTTVNRASMSADFHSSSMAVISIAGSTSALGPWTVNGSYFQNGEDPSNSTRIAALATQGANTAKVEATLGQFKGTWNAKGKTFLSLPRPGDLLRKVTYLTSAATPPPIEFESPFTFEEGSILIEGMAARVGKSDLQGSLILKFPTKDRSMEVTADLASESCYYEDIGAFLPRAAVRELPVNRKSRAAEKKQVFSSSPISFKWSNNLNLNIRAQVKRFVGKGKSALFDSLSFSLRAKEDSIEIRPLILNSERGQLKVTFIAKPYKSDLYHLILDAKAQGLDLGRLTLAYFPEHQAFGVGKNKMREMFLGAISGSILLESFGRSYKDAMANSSGVMTAKMQDGKVSSLLIELLGLDIVESVGVLVAKQQHLDIKCLEIKTRSNKGLLRVENGVLVTPDSDVLLTGSLDFVKENADIRLETKPNDMSWGVVRAPLKIHGPLSGVKLEPEFSNLTARLALSALLGTLLTPAAAAIPFVEFGLDQNHSCSFSDKPPGSLAH